MNFMTSAFGVTQLFLLILQNVLVFWAASNILDDETVATGMLFSFGTSTFLRAICQLTGIGRDMHKVWTGGYRITAFGQNENNAAIIMGTGVLVLVGLAYARRAKPPFQPRWVVLPCCALIANASLQTGSRGGLIALLAGLAMFALSKGQRAWQYVRNVVVAGVAVVVLAFGANEVPMMRYRIHDTEREGRMAGREELYPLLVQMFKDKPIIGWGPDNSHYELSLREQNVTIMNRDSHNLILEVLTNSGIIGGVVFCTGLVLCGAASWKARGSREGVLPLATFACVLMGNMSGNWMSSKLLWMALAYAVGSARRVPQPVRRGKPRSRSLHPESAVV
jgi:O-antigen ligase